MDGPEVQAVRGIAGDPALLEAFYRRHIDAVGRFVARRVDDPQSAADLSVEVFIAAMGSAGAYRGGPGGELAWLYGVARNVVASERRRSAREADASRRMAGRRVLDEDDILRLEERLDAAAAARHIYRAIERLSEDDRAVVELVSVDGLTPVEAARVLGIGPVAARVRLHRARRRLAKELGSPPAEPHRETRTAHVQAEAKA
ncbi:RNA polymerase sigma factor [Embleya sp. NPDC020886]|uniref:RNA polymerase sigma factor n=1 Tax=Embleya sp. NPDC020886 TaxID=3363980 RepID=UPI0037BB085D